MKFSINRQVLLKQLGDVQRAISSKTTIPILTGVKLVATKKGLTLSGSDTDICIETTMLVKDETNQLEITTPGSIVLPAKFFGEIIKKLASETVTLTVKDPFQTKITAGKAAYTLNGLDAKDFPRFPVIKADESVHLPSQAFKQAIQHTVIAVSTQESRPLLTGVNLTLGNGSLRAVATDSHRLSQRVFDIELPESFTDTPQSVVIPGKALVELSRIIENQEHIEMMVTDNQVLFQADNVCFYARLLEGYYPDTSRLIPDSSTSKTQFAIGANELLRATERAALLSHEGKNNVVKLSFAPDKVELFCDTMEVGNSREELPDSKMEGEELTIAFNPDYMKDALRTFGQQEVQLYFFSPVRPFVLIPKQAVGENEEAFLQLITPIRLT